MKNNHENELTEQTRKATQTHVNTQSFKIILIDFLIKDIPGKITIAVTFCSSFSLIRKCRMASNFDLG